MIYVFTLTLLLWFIVYKKVTHWYLIDNLGFSSETPQGWLNNPTPYLIAEYFLSALVIATAIAQNTIALFILFPVLFLSYVSWDWYTKKQTLKTYRRILKEISEEKKDVSIMESGNKTDKELLNQAHTRAAWKNRIY